MDVFNIVDHPDYETIVSKIVTGIPPKDINHWLRLKYPNKEQKHLQVSVRLLQEFVNKHANLMGDLRQEIVAIKHGEKIDKKLAASLLNNKDVRTRLAEDLQIEVDIKKTIKELIQIAYVRMEQVFDTIQQNPTNFKGDYVLVKYFDSLFKACEQFDKIVNNAPDQIIQHNYTVQVMEQNVAIFQEAVRSTLAQMDTEASLQFVEILNKELDKLKPPAPEPIVSLNDKKAEVMLLRERAIEAME